MTLIALDDGRGMNSHDHVINDEDPTNRQRVQKTTTQGSSTKKQDETDEKRTSKGERGVTRIRHARASLEGIMYRLARRRGADRAVSAPSLSFSFALTLMEDGSVRQIV